MTHRLSRSQSQGFTLAELLVAMSILSLIMVGVATVMSFVTAAWSSGLGAVDNNTKARVMLNLLDRDVQMMVMRRDLAAFNGSTANSTACAFYSNVQSYTGAAATMDTRAISLVQYKLNWVTDTSSTLQRLSYGSNFAVTRITPTIGVTNMLAQLTNVNVQTETVATGVIGFNYQFMDGTGTMQTTYTYNYSNPGATTNTRVLIVSMAVMSDASYKRAKAGTGIKLTAVHNFFSGTTTSATYPISSEYWNDAMNTSATYFALPSAIRSGVQIFERHIPLPMTTPSN